MSPIPPELIRQMEHIKHLKKELRLERIRTASAHRARDFAREQRDQAKVDLGAERLTRRKLESELNAKERRIETLLRARGR